MSSPMEISEEYIRSLGSCPKFGAYEAEIGVKYRIVVPYMNSFYAVFWLQFHEDGSVYFGIIDKEATKYKSGVVNENNGLFSINLEDEVPYKPIGEAFKNRFSFHGTGEIHDPATHEETFRLPTNQVNQRDELFKVFFKEISRFRCINQTRKSDLCVRLYTPPQHMLVLTATIIPTEMLSIGSGNQDSYTAILSFPEHNDIRALSIELRFEPCVDEGSPDVSLVVWPVKKDREYGEVDSP